MTTTARPTSLPELDEAGRRLMSTEARTATTFTDQPVTDEQLREIYEPTTFGPTSARSARCGPGFSGRTRAVTASCRRSTRVTAPGRIPLRWSPSRATTTPFASGSRSPFPSGPSCARCSSRMRDRAARLNGALRAAHPILAVRAVGAAAGPVNGFDTDPVDAEFFAGTGRPPHPVVNIASSRPRRRRGRATSGPAMSRLIRPSSSSVATCACRPGTPGDWSGAVTQEALADLMSIVADADWRRAPTSTIGGHP